MIDCSIVELVKGAAGYSIMFMMVATFCYAFIKAFS
jgi:hypothetical protein